MRPSFCETNRVAPGFPDATTDRQVQAAEPRLPPGPATRVGAVAQAGQSFLMQEGWPSTLPGPPRPIATWTACTGRALALRQTILAVLDRAGLVPMPAPQAGRRRPVRPDGKLGESIGLPGCSCYTLLL